MDVRALIGALCALAAQCAWHAPAAAETAAEFYSDRVVRLVVGYAAGGGYDLYARMLAPHLEQRLGATVIVDNRPGAGGIVALNEVFAASPDGLTIMLASAASSAFSQITHAEGVRYDLSRFGQLGRVIDEKRALVWSALSPYRTIEDALKSPRPILFGGVSRTDTSAATAAFVAEGLGLDARIIVGYQGSKELSLAAMRGEVDGFAASDSSASRYGREEGLIPAAVISREPSPLLPGVPTIFEGLSLSPEQAWWLDYCDALLGLGRALITTPEIPADRLVFLQDAVRDVLSDEKMIAEALDKQLPLTYAPPAAAKQMIDAILGSLTQEQLAKVRHVVLEKYQ
jgi:tripartite-type tricarboxylate transporter receptor subunit TctC